MKIAVIGAGNMGSAMINAWLDKKVCRPSDLLVFDKKFRNQKSGIKNQGGKFKTSVDDFPLLKKYDVIVLAVKPQDMAGVLEAVKPHLSAKTIILSIAAGVTIKRMAFTLGKVKIVRAMPNMPVQVGMGVVGWTANKSLTMTDKKKSEKLLSAMGKAIYFGVEKKLDAVTAVSGSGPAYVFYCMEALFEAAIGVGLNAKEATELTLGTFLGSTFMVDLSDEPPAKLRARVTSKKGTTEAAIKVFDQKKVKRIFSDAIKAAHKRAGELNL